MQRDTVCVPSIRQLVRPAVWHRHQTANSMFSNQQQSRNNRKPPRKENYVFAVGHVSHTNVQQVNVKEIIEKADRSFMKRCVSVCHKIFSKNKLCDCECQTCLLNRYKQTYFKKKPRPKKSRNNKGGQERPGTALTGRTGTHNNINSSNN